ncbi:NfeD family protein [Castellaniella sp.]|uniref:NfeD family protein n=1 Tax=Castellaniella sp. TaxID=1955812 RepID=UPI002AFE896B|nr:NfeD family protein [Castellaniella sp.]
MLLVYFGAQSLWALVLLALILALAVVIAIQAHRSRALGGNEELPGMVGEVTEATDARGRARALVRGEVWQVRCTSPLSPGQAVRVIQAHDLLLIVEPLADDVDVLSGESS